MKTIFESYFHSIEETPERWSKVASKVVKDADGFTTEYTWYTDGNIHIFMFGDSDINEPDEAYADWTAETEESAKEWFDSYTGFDDCEDYDDDDCEGIFESAESLLNRGFERKYHIPSPKVITESYGNLPKWLTDFIDREGKVIKDALSRKGIDLANATYITGVIPRSARDPEMKNTHHLAVFRLAYNARGGTREVVYIPGFTNPYVPVDPNNPYDGYKYCDELAKRDLLAMTVEYGYIDLLDSRNSNSDKRMARAQLRRNAPAQRDLSKGQHPVRKPVYDDNYKQIGFEIQWVTAKGYDKNGYKLDPEKYERMLNDVGLDSYAQRLDQMYQNIERVRDEIINLMNRFTVAEHDKYVTPAFSGSVYDTISYATQALANAIKSFNRLKKGVDQILERNQDADIYPVDQQIRDVFRWDGRYVQDYLSEAKKYTKEAREAKPVSEAIALSTIDGTVGSALSDMNDVFNSVSSKPELEAAVQSAFGADFENVREGQRDYAQRVVDTVKRYPFAKALMYIYDVILKGDGFGAIGKRGIRR